MSKLFTAFLMGLTCGVAFMGLAEGTFGKRCERAFPTDPARQALCVHNLARGLAP